MVERVEFHSDLKDKSYEDENENYDIYHDASMYEVMHNTDSTTIMSVSCAAWEWLSDLSEFVLPTDAQATVALSIDNIKWNV